MFQGKGLNLAGEQTTRRKTTRFVSVQAVPMQLIKKSFSMGHLLTVICRHYRPSECRSSGLVLEPNVMLVTAARVSGNKVIVIFWEASYQHVWKTCPPSWGMCLVLMAYLPSCAAQQTVRVGLCHLHSSSFKRRQLMK